MWGIHTVYLPRENLRFVEEWLAYHSLLGAEYFYMYDNTGSRELDWGNSVAVNGRNKYGRMMDFSLSDAEIAEIEAAIFKKYPVVKIVWQPRENGEIVYGQNAACDDFAKGMRSGWCAFLDIDEFLYSPHRIGDVLEGQAMVLRQKKFEDRFHYSTALEITNTFTIDTERWAPKIFINMEHYILGSANMHELNTHLMEKPVFPDLGTLRFNHYNHNRVGHEWLLANREEIDPGWRPLPFEQVFNESCGILRDLSREIDYAAFVPEARG